MQTPEEEIEKMFPNCNLEIKDCKLQCIRCGKFDGPKFDDDCYSESGHDADEINNILDNSDEGEIEEEENGN